METAQRECKTLLLVFSEVLLFAEGLSNTLDSDILLKSAKIVEDMYIKTHSLGAVKEFESKLAEFLALQGLKPFPLEYFKNASHLILSRYLCDSKYSDGEVKLAIDRFIFQKSEEESFQVVKQLSQTHHTVRVLMQSPNINSQLFDLKAAFFVEELKKLLINTNGNVEEVYSAIKKTCDNDKDNFKLMLKVLCLQNDCELSLHIQELISLFVSNTLKDYELSYTYSFILDLSDEDFKCLVNRWDSFTDSLLEMLDFSKGTLKCEYSAHSYSWNQSVERGLSFKELVALINKLKAVQKKYDDVKKLLQRWMDDGFSILAEDLLRICKIK